MKSLQIMGAVDQDIVTDGDIATIELERTAVAGQNGADHRSS